MLQCVEKTFWFAALASVSLLYSQTVECAETKLPLKLNTPLNLNITQNFTHDKPRVCSEENLSYCINGHCSVQENINTPSCTCHSGFLGTRCELKDLSVTGPYNLEEAIAISAGVMLLHICVCMLSCCCYRKWYCRGSKPAVPYKNQESSV